MTAFWPFLVGKPQAIQGFLTLICVCAGFHHTEPTTVCPPRINK
jgi:hypothetical protein